MVQTPDLPEPRPVTKEMVDHPDHYTAGGIEVIDVWKAKLTPEQFRGALLSNVIKYTLRAGHKENPHQDLKKAAWYLAELNKYDAESQKLDGD